MTKRLHTPPAIATTFVAVLRAQYTVTADDKGDAICKFADEFSEHHDMGAIITMVPESEWKKTEQVREVARELYECAKALLDNWENGNIREYVQSLADVIAKANGKN